MQSPVLSPHRNYLERVPQNFVLLKEVGGAQNSSNSPKYHMVVRIWEAPQSIRHLPWRQRQLWQPCCVHHVSLFLMKKQLVALCVYRQGGALGKGWACLYGTEEAMSTDNSYVQEVYFSSQHVNTAQHKAQTFTAGMCTLGIMYYFRFYSQLLLSPPTWRGKTFLSHKLWDSVAIIGPLLTLLSFLFLIHNDGPCYQGQQY